MRTSLKLGAYAPHQSEFVPARSLAVNPPPKVQSSGDHRAGPKPTQCLLIGRTNSCQTFLGETILREALGMPAQYPLVARDEELGAGRRRPSA